MAIKSCQYCQASINFEKTARGRWRPVDAGTNNWHVCKLDQTCGGCGQLFQGAPWMKKCPSCFKDDKPSRRGFKQPAETGNFGDQPARSKSRYPERPNTSREPLTFGDRTREAGEDFDDIPF